jgi:hemin uptake protein HemP
MRTVIVNNMVNISVVLNQKVPKGLPAAADQARRVRSVELLGTPGELLIEHQGREYRLRITRNGKLILTA